MGLFPVAAANMVAGTLYTYPDNFRAQKALIAAKYSGAQLTVAKDFVFGETNKSPDFLKKFPLGKVPAFEGSDGTILTESNAIAYYVANDELRGGNDAAARAQVVQWMCMADNEILPASCTWVFPTMGIMQYNKNATDRAKEDIKAALKTLNDHLLTRTYLVGESVTLADIAVACTILGLYKQVLDPSFRKPFMNVTRWFTTIVNSPKPRMCSEQSLFALKWQNLMPRNLPSFQVRELGTKREKRKHQRPKRRKNLRRRKRRKKNLSLMKSQWNPRKKILWMLCQRVLLIWRNGKGSILTMMRTPPSLGSGSILTMKITPSGEAIINTMMSSLWSSCPAISLVECSSAWRNSRKMLLHPVVCSARTTIPPSVGSGSSRGNSWPLN